MGFEYPRPNDEYKKDLERFLEIKESFDMDDYTLRKLRYRDLSDVVLDYVESVRKNTQFVRFVFKEAGIRNRLPSEFEEVEKQAEAIDCLVDEYLTETAGELGTEFRRYEKDLSYEAETRRKTLKHYYERIKSLGLDRIIPSLEKYKHKPVKVKKEHKKLKWALPIIFIASNIITAYVINPDWFANRAKDIRYSICYVLNATPNEKCRKEEEKAGIEQEKDAGETEGSKLRKEAYTKALGTLNEALEALRRATGK